MASKGPVQIQIQMMMMMMILDCLRNRSKAEVDLE
jgi:hypothetical protein